MKKNILIFAHTEYHLLIAINQILSNYGNPELYDVELIIKVKRLSEDLDLSHLPVRVGYFSETLSINHPISQKTRAAVEGFFQKKPDIFIFFQEMDPLMVILSGYYSRKGATVFLFQDGSKAYMEIPFISLGLLWHNHKQNLWLKKNGFRVDSWTSPIRAKKYAYLRSIHKVFLTFPEAYHNWNRKALEKIKILPRETLNPVLKKVFHWDETLLPEKERVIFYMNQPMHDDGVAETRFLEELTEKYPNTPVFVKLHPLTNEVKIRQYRKFPQLRIINSNIPAELFIMNLERSIVLSVNSTAMFMDNPKNNFYYLYKVFEKEIKRLSRYKFKENPAPHIRVLNSIDEIKF